jgi:Uma2 family endonuclease
MGMPAAHSEWTVDLLDSLPDSSDRFELIDGDLIVTPAPGEPHQLVVFELFTRLRNFLDSSRVGLVLGAPADVWRNDRRNNRLQPDIFVLRLTEGKRPPYPYHIRDLLLAVEVATPGNPLADYQIKRDVYLSEGLPEYWVVNPELRNVTRCRGADGAAELLHAKLEWQPHQSADAFALDLSEFFDKALR